MVKSKVTLEELQEITRDLGISLKEVAEAQKKTEAAQQDVKVGRRLM